MVEGGDGPPTTGTTTLPTLIGNHVGTHEQARVGASTTADQWPPGYLRLYHDRYDAMVRVAYLMTGSDLASEDLVQDAFVKVHRAWRRIDDPPAYLRQAVVNECRSWHRTRLRRRDKVDQHAHDLAVDAIPATQVHDELWDRLGTLSQKRREVVVLRFYEDLPLAEIAEVLGTKVGTVKSLLHRAVKQLEQDLRDDTTPEVGR